MATSKDHYQLGRFTLDGRSQQLLQDGKEVTLEPRVFSLLFYLARNEGRLVSKEEMINAVWQQKIVSDGAISTAVNSLRKVLCVDTNDDVEVKSVYGKGLLLKIKNPHDVNSGASPLANSLAQRQPKVCVLPFRIIGETDFSNAISRCLEEEIYAGLCRTKAFFVLSRQTSLQFRPDANLFSDLSERFELDYAIDGSVSVMGSEFRSHLFLVDLKRNTPIWSADFQGSLESIFDVQEDIVRRLVGSVLPEVLNSEISYISRRNPADWDAYDRTLAAMPFCWKLNRDSNVKAVDLLDAALEVEPSYGLAIALKAWCLAQRVIYGWNELVDYPKQLVVDLSSSALDKDGSNPLVLTVYSMALTLLGDLSTSRRAVAKAIEIDPNLAWGWNRMGWIDGYDCDAAASIKGFERSMELSPLDPMRFNCYFGIAQAHFVGSEYQSCIEWLDRALFERNDAIFMHRLRAAACFYNGDLSEARTSIRLLLQDNSAFDPVLVSELVPFSKSSVREKLAHGIKAAM